MRILYANLVIIQIVLSASNYFLNNNYIDTYKSPNNFQGQEDGISKLPLSLNDLQYHGTTTLSFIHGENIILCVDSKASIGNYIGSRTVKKVFPINKYIVATMAGGAADCAYWIRRISAVSRMLEHRYDTTLTSGAIARVLSKSLKEYKGNGLSVGTMVAGWNPIQGPSISYVDSEGICVDGNLFCVGSGAQFAYAILDSISEDNHNTTSTVITHDISIDNNNYNVNSLFTNRKEKELSSLAKLPLVNAIDVAIQAVRHATYRDGYSGGYINVLMINSTGIHHIYRIDSKTIKMGNIL